MIPDCFNKRGLSIVELGVSILIFSLILLCVFGVLSIGLKCWQIGDISSESQQSAEVSIHRIMSELKFSNISTCLYDSGPANEYISFDTAFKQGKMEVELYSQTPVWQGHIVYYTYDEGASSGTKTLYRRFIPHNTMPVPQKLNPLTPMNYLVNTNNVSGDSDETLKVISRNIKRFYTIREGEVITINLTCFKSMDDKKLPYDQDFKKNLGATMNISASVSPRN